MGDVATYARPSRIGQIVLFAITVGLLVAVAAVEPLLTRSFSDAIVRSRVASVGVASGQVQLRGPEGVTGKIERSVDPRVRAVTAGPIETRATTVLWPRRVEHANLQSTQGQCAHVRMVSGRCPTARNEVMLPAAQAKAIINPRLRLGEKLTVKGAAAQTTSGSDTDLDPQKQLTVVGVFTAADSDPFWAGAGISAYNPVPPADGRQVPAATWLTPAATFAGRAPTTEVPRGNMTSPQISWGGILDTVAYPLDLARIDPGSLSRAVSGLQETSDRLGADVSVSEALTSVHDDTVTDTGQVGQILPFLLAQLGAVLLILLSQVAGFLATARRGEAAVLKLRGNGTVGVLRTGARELLPAWVVGSVAGLGLAYGVDAVVRLWWLPGGVPASWVWSCLPAAAGAAVLAAGLWWVVWWLMAREPISVLLRARPPRRGGVRVSTPVAVLGALCLVGVVLTATESLTGAAVQITPLLLAGLVAVVVSVLLAPVAGVLVRALMRRRRAAGALAIAQLGRRAGVATAVATLIITSALLTLSVSVYARGADNRATRAAADLGAPAVVQVLPGSGAAGPADLLSAVGSADPDHRLFAPVVQIDAATPTSNATLGVTPADMRRIGLRAGLPHPVPWSALERTAAGGEPAALVASWTTPARAGATVTAPTMADMDGPYRVVGAVPYLPGVGSRTIVVDLAQMIKAGDRTNNVSFQVYSATQDRGQLHRLDAAVRNAGFGGTTAQTLGEARARYDRTATAWATNFSTVVSALAVLAALVSVSLVAIASRADRKRDLQALRTGGLPSRLLRRATVGEFAVLAFLGTAIGAVTAPLAAWLTGRTMLWWSTPPDQPLTRTGFDWPAGAAAAAALAVLLVTVATAFGLRIARVTARSEGVK